MSCEKSPIGAYWYPLTVNCKHRQKRAHELGCQLVDETLLAQVAQELFPGHDQPRQYCLGDPSITNWDDSNPKHMARQLELAIGHGLRFFVFDTYIGIRDGRVRKEVNAPLDNTFLKLEQGKSMDFAIMAVLGSPRVVLPVPRVPDFEEPNRYYDVSVGSAQAIINHCVKTYWHLPNYLTIGGRPYISVFTSDLSPTNGADKKERFSRFIQEISEYAWKKYKIDPYVVGVVRKQSAAQQMEKAGVTALTGYAFLADFGSEAEPIQDYKFLMEKRVQEWYLIGNSVKVPFVPPAVTGWDASPRGQSCFSLQEVTGYYPYTPIVTGNTPQLFGQMMQRVEEYTNNKIPIDERYMIICAWNEITEGASLLPRVIDGSVNMDYLKVVKTFADKREQI